MIFKISTEIGEMRFAYCFVGLPACCALYGPTRKIRNKVLDCFVNYLNAFLLLPWPSVHPVQGVHLLLYLV